MINNKNYTYKWHRKAELCIIFHICFFTLNLVFGGIFAMNFSETIYLIVFLNTILAHIIATACFIYLGWYATMFLDDDKIWIKIAGKSYEWHWSEMTDCLVSTTIWFARPPLVKIITSSKYRELSFCLNIHRFNQFLAICPNQKIREQFVNNWPNILGGAERFYRLSRKTDKK